MKVLFIGDICGRIGRKAVAELLPKLKKEHEPDLVIANADNTAHGTGITLETLHELLGYGIDFLSNGDHAFDKDNDLEEIYNGGLPIVRPANFPPICPGKGYSVIKTKAGDVLFINLAGRVFMKQHYDCPFREADNILANFAKQSLSAIIVDIHAEATAEKVALRHYLDGRVSAILGTHTHIMTADAGITDKKTAYITDVGVTGAGNTAVLGGIEKSESIRYFLSQIKYHHILPETGDAEMDAVLLEINADGKTEKITPIIEKVNIN